VQNEFTNERRSQRAGVRPGRAQRVCAAPFWAGAVALLIASAAGCGDGGDAGATPSPTSQQPASPSSNPSAPANPETAPPAAADPPATSNPDPALPASESPMGMVPLDPTPAPMAGNGEDNAPEDGDDGAPDDSAPDGNDDAPPSEEPPADDTSTDPDEPPADDTPEPEPTPEPPVFAPCPSDGSPCRIMPLGDSITFGIGARTPLMDQGGYRMELFRMARADGHALTFVGRQVNGPATVANQAFPQGHEGYPGATINDGNNQLANRVDGAVAAADPDIVLLMIGTNDVNGNINNPPDDLRNLINQITNGAPDALLVVAQIVPTRTAGTNTRVQAYNATVADLVRESAAAGKHVTGVDMFSAFTANPNFGTALLNDNLHPNDAGFVVMAQTWYPAIEAALR
jgi:lysophospholipase L1-like esterase